MKPGTLIGGLELSIGSKNGFVRAFLYWFLFSERAVCRGHATFLEARVARAIATCA